MQLVQLFLLLPPPLGSLSLTAPAAAAESGWQGSREAASSRCSSKQRFLQGGGHYVWMLDSKQAMLGAPHGMLACSLWQCRESPPVHAELICSSQAQ
jgi:hypothetical protein